MDRNLILNRLISRFGGDWFTEEQARDVLEPEELSVLSEFVQHRALLFSGDRYRFLTND